MRRAGRPSGQGHRELGLVGRCRANQLCRRIAAGDTFIGALGSLLVDRRSMDEALAHVFRAAAICVTRAGAQASMPSREEVERFA